ncbi:MAG: hypothetical protein KatS3mg088_613 [Patescibacteria group bacterium]|nr:MAG: hypothetical protein KatS3mg088_613 [Patescibacteria group bacterium]
MRKNIFLAFTMIEVLIVIAFLSLMVVISIFVFKSQISKGYDARRKSDLDRIKIALEEYEKDNNCYPPYLPSCRGADAGILKSYISAIPCDPHTKTDYVYYADPSSVCAKWAWIFTNLEYIGDPKIKELGCENGCGPSQSYGFNYYVTTPSAPDPFKSGNPNVPPDATGTYYGCFSGVCQPISIDPYTKIPVCQPNFSQSDCRGLCIDGNGNSINQCQ